MLAAKEVDPPVSLGLFGDCGTGKSFFMRRIEGRIRELTDDAKQANGESQYCQDVVQITFNAWNYIDKDLWASLASEIFEGLAAALANKRGGDSQEGRALALAAASSSPTVVAETERQKCEAEERLKESEEKLTELQQRQRNIKPRLSAREVLNQAVRFAIKVGIRRATKSRRVATAFRGPLSGGGATSLEITTGRRCQMAGSK